ncbi:MAG TPA: hypothetical protein VM327_08195 [Candidatus Thermoplasmatota archaeon]|nr:hypothetical protein [Candidatus Thermoplasmatota archaeon]
MTKTKPKPKPKKAAGQLTPRRVRPAMQKAFDRTLKDNHEAFRRLSKL